MDKDRNPGTSDIIIVITTSDSRDEAVKLGRMMVEKRLAACAQISGPIESHFWWDGKLDRAEEWQCRFKTSRKLYSALEQEIRKAHSYQVPQIVAVPVLTALTDFESWVMEETDQISKEQGL